MMPELEIYNASGYEPAMRFISLILAATLISPALIASAFAANFECHPVQEAGTSWEVYEKNGFQEKILLSQDGTGIQLIQGFYFATLSLEKYRHEADPEDSRSLSYSTLKSEGEHPVFSLALLAEKGQITTDQPEAENGEPMRPSIGPFVVLRGFFEGETQYTCAMPLPQFQALGGVFTREDSMH